MIKVIITADSKYPIERKRIKKLVEEFFKKMEVSEMEVGIAVVGDRKMRELNKQYLKVEGTTDVLSFSQTENGNQKFVEKEGTLYLGDVIVSWPQARRQAMERNIMVDEEIDFLVEHGLLHLMGIHHD